MPIKEQEQAKQRGARWDGEHKCWYIPEGTDRMGFEQWLPTPQASNRRAPEWFLAARKTMAELLKELS